MGHWLGERLADFGDALALVGPSGKATYQELVGQAASWTEALQEHRVERGETVAFVGETSPSTVGLLLALIQNRNIAVPLTAVPEGREAGLLDTAGATSLITVDGDGTWTYERRGEALESAPPSGQELVERLRTRGAPGLILFTSGSTGASKASLLDFDLLLAKFEEQRRKLTSLVFMNLDHIGGINTLFYLLSTGSTAVSIAERSTAAVCEAIERHRVELLPTTPTFLNMLLISGAHRTFDLSSLEVISYGTEPMPEATLLRLAEALPEVHLKQTYGLSELGILATRSKSSDSLWVKVGGDGYETKVVGGTLWIRAQSAMLGYLNAPSPFDDDGWFDTGDEVETDGEYVRFLGRASERINVGGEKVHPVEVESVILEMDNVADATVVGKSNPVVGSVVVAAIKLHEPEDPIELERRVREFCGERLEPYKVPAVITITDASGHSSRFKKVRCL